MVYWVRNSLTVSIKLSVKNLFTDPWSGGGVLRSFNDKVDVVIIPEGAHHIDLRAEDKLDPASVKEARKFHIKKFRKWISEFVAKTRI
jgi:lysosomal Pro-X carboxypeptidase